MVEGPNQKKPLQVDESEAAGGKWGEGDRRRSLGIDRDSALSPSVLVQVRTRTRPLPDLARIRRQVPAMPVLSRQPIASRH